jgi:dipeptidase E
VGKIVTIGGVTPPLSLDLIDEEIIRLTQKKNPKVLYLPTAGGDDLGYCDFFKSIYEGKFGCKVDVLFLIRETPTDDEIREKVFSSDIIYIEGGSISRLMATFKKFNLDKILKEAYEKEIVFAGKSAGAFCMAKYYFENDDVRDFKIDGFNDYIKVECLNFLDFIICPHYNLDGYSETMEAMIKEKDVIGIGIDNNCALEIIDGYYRVIATHDSANAYKVYKEGTSIKKEIITKDCNFRSIDKLIQVLERTDDVI